MRMSGAAGLVCIYADGKLKFTSDLPVSPISIKGNADLEVGVVSPHHVAALLSSRLVQKFAVEANADFHNTEVRVQRVWSLPHHVDTVRQPFIF